MAESHTNSDAPAHGSLYAIWQQDLSDPLICCGCQKLIENEFVRTFCVSKGMAVAKKNCSKVIKGDEESLLILYDRHLACLEGARYVAVSHVWDPAISKIQDQGDADSETVVKIWQRIVDVARKLHTTIHGPQVATAELWLDYISVPQWSSSIKSRILSIIPRIFLSAEFTAVYLADLGPESARLLREGKNSQELVDGITGLCGVSLYRRVWCAMELIRSPKVRLINGAFEAYDNDKDPFYIKEMNRVWGKLLGKHGTVPLEGMAQAAGHGNNFIPWQVGPLFEIRNLGTTNFAHAFSMLSSRGCLTDIDFMHAFNGIVQHPADLADTTDHLWAHLMIAKSCLQNGDHSPLLMTPELRESGHEPRDHPFWQQSWALNDTFTWGMGTAISPPSLTNSIRLDPDSSLLSLDLAETGSVVDVKWNGREGYDEKFAEAADFVLNLTGSDVEHFVSFLGPRLYDHQDTARILDFIAKPVDAAEPETTRRDRVEWILKYRLAQDSFVPWTWSSQHGPGELCALLGMDGSAIRHLLYHGNRIHLSDRGYLIRVRCSSCKVESVFRAAVFSKPRLVKGAILYRVPGLQYHATRKHGVGFLINNGNIIGRTIWAVPLCACSLLSTVRVHMPRIPKRRPLPSGA
jgi:hypothetical protein